MISLTKIGIIEWAGPAPSQEKVIHILCKCQCGRTASRSIPCPADLATYPCGTMVAINEFGRLEAVPEVS
jgi:hypothetical protein